jgi:SEC-C motif domain protein
MRNKLTNIDERGMVFEPCPCGSQRPFSDCCEPYLLGEALAPTAEALMRSRYSAFCRGPVDYLLATHHASQRQPGDLITLKRSVKKNRWANLLIVSQQKGQAKDDTGVVEFVAAYRTVVSIVTSALSGGTGPELEKVPVLQLHERSQFVKEGDRWFYTVGDILPPYEPKRTQPCWCGSGKKFKQCHG